MPDGNTANVHRAAPWVRWGWVLWCAALLLQVIAGPLDVAGDVVMVASLLPLAGGFLIASQPPDGARSALSLRHGVRLLVPIALALTLAPLPGARLLALGLWGLLPLVFWAYCRQLVHRGTALDRRLRRLMVAWGVLNGLTAAAVGPFWLEGLQGGLIESVYGLALLTWMLGATALWYTSSRVMRAFGDWGLAQHTSLQEYVATGAFRLGEAWLAYSHARGWSFEPDDDGVAVSGTLEGGRRVRVRVWSAMAPASMEIRIAAPKLAGLRIAHRGGLDSPQRVGDPLLDSCLDVADRAPGLGALLAGQHEALMEIFHANPTARLEGGWLTMRSDDASTLVADPLLSQAAALLDTIEQRRGKQAAAGLKRGREGLTPR